MIFDSKNQEEILRKVYNLRKAHQDGLLGGEKMPEDENPHLDKESKENYMYFTLPMALNYQRNSYVLWECANRMYADETARAVYDAKAVCNMEETLRDHLVNYKVALQSNKQPVIWKTLCETIENTLDGDIRNLFLYNEFSVKKVKDYIQSHKKEFPYLGGNKICNYWMYVLEKYTDIRFVDRENITVAPDTHVVQASTRLGVISEEEAGYSNVQELLADRWAELLKGTELVPIDVHTPMWLWSRGKFEVKIYEDVTMLKLRPYKPCDSETIVSWCKDEASFRRWTSDRYDKFPITAEDMNKKYIDNNGDCPDLDNFYPMTAFDENGIVGSLILRFNNEERTIVRLGFIIVDDTKRGKGYGKKMVQLATKYAFEFLGAEKVTLGVFDNNPAAYHCYKAAGFKETGEIFNISLFEEMWTVVELKMEREEYEALIHY